MYLSLFEIIFPRKWNFISLNILSLRRGQSVRDPWNSPMLTTSSFPCSLKATKYSRHYSQKTNGSQSKSGKGTWRYFDPMLYFKNAVIWFAQVWLILEPVTLCSPFCFLLPPAHLTALMTVWSDEVQNSGIIQVSPGWTVILLWGAALGYRAFAQDAISGADTGGGKYGTSRRKQFNK